MQKAPRLGMVAGEASGDLLASLLLQGLRARWPGLASQGIGGPKMQAQGFESWWPHSKLSIFGYVDALLNIRELLSIRKQLGKRLISNRPDVFIGVDAPDFNFGLEARLREAGIKTVHFVCPSIWAWRPERVETIRRAADHVLCLFPFEPEILHKAGIGATYVGHPLADAIPMEPPRAASREALGLPADDTVIALLPGSRKSEIKYIAPALIGAARLLARPGRRFILPVVPGLRHLVEPLLGGVDIQLIDGQSHAALAACDLTLVASGTATLEAALFKRPMVIAYRMNWLNWWRMKDKGLLPWVGLPNILAREFLVPELIQHACTPEALAREAEALLADAARRDALHTRFVDLHTLLRQDTARRASDAIASLLGA
ncbi:lipid-A-disaccharide synthase [Roseateles puraquae]|uniref:Lipid-A-disaccharide synthase n=1 Tax=Roseateles puraquae TaxID=431059 RepID=A0A254NHF1_9BURK|nr:lipid-A-disaccharide synthase [Roseateles puraquae]MDG0856056.1 lipid-A-disaccharide synthase [Roseateles puraquae]OWR05607.1 lipid-A-disaccharide synthase [Roseateles puraquae]